MASWVKRSSIANTSKVYALTDELKIIVKSGWKQDDPWEQDRLGMCKACEKDVAARPCTPDTEDEQCLDGQNLYKYTYVALEVGKLMFEMPDGRVYQTTDVQHFTLAYLPGLDCWYKTRMWRDMREIVSNWIDAAKEEEYFARPFQCLSLRACKILSEFHPALWDIRWGGRSLTQPTYRWHGSHVTHVPNGAPPHATDPYR